MTTRLIQGRKELESLVGQDIATSDWFRVTQERVDQFAASTDDRQWIHCDPERAREQSPFGAAVAHGFLTLALAPALMEKSFTVDGVRMAVNYGLNRVRFPAPVPVGSDVRMTTHLQSIDEVPGGVQMACRLTFEVKGQAKPACVAEMLMRLIFDLPDDS